MNEPRPAAACWLAFLPVLLLAIPAMAPPLNLDVAAVLAFAQRWLIGERLYVDLIDVNPPLVFVLNLGPAALARLTGLDPVVALRACLLAWAALVWALALKLRDRGAAGPAEGLLLAVLPGLILFVPGSDFGQRDPFMAASALPYLYAAARRARGEAPRGRVAAALLAAVGFAIKPYFLTIPALVELAVLASTGPRRWWRDPTPWLMATLWAAYLAALPLAFPNYLSFVLPLVRDLYLNLSGLGPLDMLRIPRVGVAALLLAALAWPAMRPGAAPMGRMFALAALGGLASALVQRKGWSYQSAPLAMFTLALATWLAARRLDLEGAARRLAVPRQVALLGLAFVVWAAASRQAPWPQLTYPWSPTARLAALLQREAGGGRVLALSPRIVPIFPAINYAHALPAMRSMNIWLLEANYRTCPPGGERFRAPADMPRSERFVFDTTAADFARDRPAAVLIDSYTGMPDCGGEPFDLLAYFSRHPRFAETWSHYRPAGEVDGLNLFTRKD